MFNLKKAKEIKVLGVTVKPKNKFYWLEGVTEKGVKARLSNEDPDFKWLRPQRNRRVVVLLMGLGLILTSLGSYWPTLKTNLNLSSGEGLIVYSVTAIFVVLATLGCYSLLRISVRSITDAPDELLDERQIQVRNTSFRYAYYAMGYLVLGLLLLLFFGPRLSMFQPEGNDGSYLVVATLFAFSAMPSMVMAWRERDI
jgi:FtsH-binding integral membrane protein